MTEIARFADVYEAEIAASRLRADGFDPVLGGAEHVKTNPLVLMALGGVNMTVPGDQADAARLLLDNLRGGAERIEDADPVADQARRDARPSTAVAVAALLGLLMILFGSLTSSHFDQYLERAKWARVFGYTSG